MLHDCDNSGVGLGELSQIGRNTDSGFQAFDVDMFLVKERMKNVILSD
jgi:hypothetical protein